jgi:hypothetical protein
MLKAPKGSFNIGKATLLLTAKLLFEINLSGSSPSVYNKAE